MVYIGAFLIAVLIQAIVAIPAYLLWNGIIPEVFSGPHLTYLQVFGILILVNLITSAFSGKS
jgi:hypothetical protein